MHSRFLQEHRAQRLAREQHLELHRVRGEEDEYLLLDDDHWLIQPIDGHDAIGFSLDEVVAFLGG